MEVTINVSLMIGSRILWSLSVIFLSKNCGINSEQHSCLQAVLNKDVFLNQGLHKDIRI